MITLYILCVAISIAMCFWYFLVDVRRSIVQNIMLLVMTLANIGYFSLALQTDLPAALLSCKIYYLGACFLPMLYFFTICEMCEIHLKTHAIVFITSLEVFVFLAVCTIGYYPFFYSDAELVFVNGITTLKRSYGPLHILHPVTMYSYFAASLIISIYAVIKNKNVEKSGLIVVIICEGLAMSYYLVERWLNLTYDFTPIVYIVLMLGAFIHIYKSDIFDVVENEEVIEEQLEKVGFITFDKKMKYMGCNDFALNVFPSLQKAVVGKKFKNTPAELVPNLKEIEDFIWLNRNTSVHQDRMLSNIKIGERTFETKVHTLLSFRKKCAGVNVELRDITEHIRVLELTERYNEELNKEVEIKTEKIRTIQEKMILGMAQMVESRDLSTGGHIKRTSDVIKIFAKKLLRSDLGLNRNFLKLVIRSAPMHDLGKIGVDDAILRKQARFTDEEYEKMKTHAQIGSEIVKKVLTDVEEPDFVRVADNVAHYHHEKVNGMGYPCGLKGEEIPVEARIMALADVFDALVSKRCYKDSFSYDKAFSIIQEDAGSHFDEKLAAVFLTCREELEKYYDSSEH